MNNITLTADVNSKVNLVKSIANKTRGPYTPEKYGSVIIPMAGKAESLNAAAAAAVLLWEFTKDRT